MFLAEEHLRPPGLGAWVPSSQQTVLPIISHRASSLHVVTAQIRSCLDVELPTKDDESDRVKGERQRKIG